MVHLFGCLSNFHCDKCSDIYLINDNAATGLLCNCVIYICICNKFFYCVNSSNIPFVNPYLLNTIYPEKLGTLFAMFFFFSTACICFINY